MALIIILVGLTMISFSEKMLISTRGLMPKLIKKSVTVSSIGGYSMFTCSVWHNSLISSGMWIIDLTSIPQLYKAGRSREQPMKRIDVLQVNTVDMYLQCTFINKHTNKNLWQLSFEKLEIVYGHGFQLELLSISWVISHMTCYKFECSHWLNLRANLVKDFSLRINFPPIRALEL